MTTFKEYASKHPTIQIDERLNDMEISDDVLELLELHTQFDENVVDEFEMGDCTYARATYFDDHTVGVVATTGGTAPVEVVGLFGGSPIFYASAPDTYDRTTYEPQRVKSWSDLCGRLRSDTRESVHWEYRVEIGDTDPGETPYDYELSRNVTFADGRLTPEERVNQFLTLGQVALDAHYHIRQCPELDDHLTYIGMCMGTSTGVSSVDVGSMRRPNAYDCKRSSFRIQAKIDAAANQLSIIHTDYHADIVLPVGAKLLTATDKDMRVFISDAVSDIIANPLDENAVEHLSDIISDLGDTNQLNQQEEQL